MFRSTWIAIILTLQFIVRCSSQQTVHFEQGMEYTYHLDGTTVLNNVGKFTTEAKVVIVALNDTLEVNTQHCLLIVEDYRVQTQPLNKAGNTVNDSMDFSNWLSFNINGNGEVTGVFYQTTEDMLVLTMKKIILGLISSKLFVSESQEKIGQRWAYEVNETGHEGTHGATYQVEPLEEDILLFIKTKKEPLLKGAHHKYKKVVLLHRGHAVPQEYNVQEDFTTPEDSGYNKIDDTRPYLKETEVFGLPSMGGNSYMKIKLENVLLSNKVFNNLPEGTELSKTSLTVKTLPPKPIKYDVAQREIARNITCVKKYKDSKRAIPCFHNIISILERLSEKDIDKCIMNYRNTDVWLIIVDALGAIKTNETLIKLTNEVLKSEKAKPKEIMHTVTHFIDVKSCLPWIVLKEMEQKVFINQWDFQDEQSSSQVNDRAMLVLGVLVNTQYNCNRTWSVETTKKLESILGVHDPFHHRQMRSTKTDKEIKQYLNKKCVHIQTLGNAAQPSSYDYIVSFLNTTDTHMQLRFSALHAVSNYLTEQAATVILTVALTDEEESVRLNAIESYRVHPSGGDLSYFAEKHLYRYDNLTSVEHVRIRRGLKDVVSRIWKGFNWRLESPSMDWKKTLGGTNLGASFGVLIKNALDIKIAPLSGHLLVDVHDKAWAALHIGVIGINLDIFRAEICYKGKIEYEINILGEYGFADLNTLADLYNNNIKKIVEIIKNAIQSFRELVQTWKNFDVGDIINDFVDSVKALPKDVTNLRKVARKVLKALEEYADLPPVYDLIKELIKKVTGLFNDIKTDVMKLYDAIVDTVSTTLPWAWDEIKTAFKDIIKAFKNILKNPKTSFQNMGRGVARISTAIAAVLDAKDKIVEANIFDKDNRPYWFDIKDVLQDIWNDTLKIKQAIEDTIEWIKGETDDGEAGRYTGVDLVTMKRQALKEVWKIIKEDLLKGPIENVERFLNPFLKTYKFFTETVENIKLAWKLLVDGYQKGKTLLDMVFGPKFHKDFPRKYLESSNCGNGFWESTGKGNYRFPGVDAEVSIADNVVAPFNGLLYESGEVGENQVTIDIDGLKNTQIILDNVQITPSLNRKEVGAGDIIGTVVHPRWCVDGHIHLSMRKINSSVNFINPSRYMERRKMPPPKWREECDHYVLKWMGKTIQSGSVTADPEIDDKTPDIPNAPSTSELEEEAIQDDTSSGKRRKRAIFDNIIDRFENFTKSLGLPGFNKLKEIFSLNINSITLGTALDYLDDFGLSNLKDKILKMLKKVEGFVNQQTCNNPNSMDDNELKAALTLRGKPTSGARKTLIKRYLESDSRCFGLHNHVKENIYCAFQSDCLGISCCLDLKFFIYRHAVVAFIRYDPCTENLVMGIGKWTKTIHITAGAADEGSEPEDSSTKLLNIAQLMVYYNIKQEDGILKVSLGVRWCSTKSEDCQELIMFIREAQFDMRDCSVTNTTELTLTSPAESVDSLLNKTIKDVIKLIEFSGLDEDDFNELAEYLRQAFQSWLRTQIENMVIKIFGNEFDLFDVCMKGYSLSYGPYKVRIFSYSIYIPLGPVPLFLNFGIDGYYGAEFHVNLCVLSMKATAVATPRIGSAVWGSVSVSLFILKAELRLTGYLLTTSFPTKAEIGFSKFPLEVKARMDLQLIPLHIELRAILKLEINLWFKKIRKTLINKKLWSYTSPAINKNIFNINDAEQDDTPPDFAWYGKAKYKEEEKKEKRSASTTTPQCEVFQIPGRDYTDPAFVLQFDVEDDRSLVTLSFCVGSYEDGCDIIHNEPLGGTTTTVVKAMASGQTLHFTVTAKNNAGLAVKTVCQLPTYDMTLPTGRVIPQFHSSSHPGTLKASILVTDDSVIKSKQVSVGYGEMMFGWQTIDWEVFETTEDNNKGYVGSNPLTQFTNPKVGKLPWVPFFQEVHDEPEECAKRCLSYQPSKCQGFNFNYDGNGLCELLDIVEGQITLKKSGQFYYYERLGVGHVAVTNYNNLNLSHNALYYFNVFLENVMEYQNILSSVGILVDLTPPDPGYIENEQTDTTIYEQCESYCPASIKHRCAIQTTIPNYRYIIDGEGSRCVFNGHKDMIDERFTRANKMASANWDGIHDNETGILMYTWSVGEAPCSQNIHPHNDPHAHLTEESEWTHTGTAYPLNLKDGAYYVTVRALNKVEFGGPLALTVCHYLPLIVDNTPPTIDGISDAVYNEERMVITISFNASDDLSGIQNTELALGRSPYDTYILGWRKINNSNIDILFHYRIPDGVPVWVKCRLTNNVNLKSVGHAPKAIFVDQTPPIQGIIYHGFHQGLHQKYQYDDKQMCVIWEGFYDPDSGIGMFKLAVGTTPLLTNIHAYVDVAPSKWSYCFKDLSLLHNTTYYATMITFNGAHDGKNITSYSDGVLIDTTPPTEGHVKDGLINEDDIKYTSDPATVKASWSGFTDPESGLTNVKFQIYKKFLGAVNFRTVYKQTISPPNKSQIELHHLDLLHGDQVQLEVKVTNGAGRSSSVQSDGFTVDLTKPSMLELKDGYNVSTDMQYTASLTSMAATWHFEDPESDIVRYHFTVFLLKSGRKQIIYPLNNPWKELPPSTKYYKTEEVLALHQGAQYKIQLAAVNGAGLTAVHNTDGVIVDLTPPQILYVHAGVYPGETEELIDGFVFHNDPEKLLGSWSAYDPESKILEYLVSIGSSPGAEDILRQQSYGKKTSVLMESISLSLTSTITNTPLYYINVIAINGAGMRSEIITSSPVKVVAADQAGIVWDGPGLELSDDVDSVLGHYTITAHFSGFESARYGIAKYEWALGSRPRYDDVKSFSQCGIIHDDHNGTMIGLGSSGKVHDIIGLTHGSEYFITIRAITGYGTALDVSSDGFIVDEKSPIVHINLLPVETSSNNVTVYKTDKSTDFMWTVYEEESDIEYVFMRVGTYPGSDDIIQQKALNKSTSNNKNKLLLDLSNGHVNFLSITVQNNVGLSSEATSVAVIIDTTPPTEGYLLCPSIITSSSIACNWNNVYDKESGIRIFLFGIGTVQGMDNVMAFTKLDNNIYYYRASNNMSVVNHNVEYFVTLTAVNNAGLSTNIYSSPMKADNTPPKSGLVVELSDHYIIDLHTMKSYGNADISNHSLTELDNICQRDISKVEIAWEAFIDEESLIDYYEVALGVTPGRGDIYPFTKVKATFNRYTFYPLNLYHIKRVFATVRGYNMVGLSSTSISNGVYISRFSTGLPALKPLKIYDGRELEDIDYQYQNDRISSHWDISGDPCPVSSIQWSIFKFDGTVVSPMEDVSPDKQYAEKNEIPIHDKDSFFVALRVTNMIGHSYSLHSDGVTIELQPLIPGQVYDGDIIGVDLNYQPSTSSLSANWDGFGSDKQTDINNDIGHYQDIHHYEIAIGTDRRYPSTRNDIHPFLDVGLNKTWTFFHLNLVPKTSVYYVSVRAYSLSTTSVEVISNGIHVGYGGQIIDVGKIIINRFISSTDELSFSLTDFKFLVPVLHNYWGLKSGNSTSDSIQCPDMEQLNSRVHKLSENFSSSFDVVAINAFGTDKFVQKNNLSLTHGSTYSLYVLSVDESGTCAMISTIFTVDTTPPDSVIIGTGPNLDLKVLYIPNIDQISAWWSGSADKESGIKDLQIALMLGTDCDNFNPYQMTVIKDYISLPTDFISYTFIELELKIGQPYFLVIKETNEAGLETISVSRPILADIKGPSPGKVADGDTFIKDIYFWGTNKIVTGSLLYLPNPSNNPCPYQEYTMTRPHSNWNPIIHRGMWLMNEKRITNIIFKQQQVVYTNTGMSLIMEYDIQEEQLLSGAVITAADIGAGGNYEFQLRSADSLHSVTAITYADWNAKIFSDLSSPILSQSNNSREESKSYAETNGYTIIQDPLPDDTYPSEYDSDRPIGNSFGMHITQDTESNQYHVILWACSINSSRYIDVLLSFDPSVDWHTYKLLINDEEQPQTENDWTLKLLIDDKVMAEIVGIAALHINSTLLLGVYNNHGIYSKVENMDVFNPPKTQASFRNLKFSASSNNLCRYGEAFMGGDHPILRFYAGLGTTRGQTDVMSYKEVYQPCIPCNYPCDTKICDVSCKGSDIQLIKFQLDGLNLIPSKSDTNENSTLLTPYYLSVKGITGSGKSTVKASNGFYIDTTPVEVRNIYHIDMAWNSYEPTEFQGSNSSIMVYWEGVEEESVIIEYQWAIGTSPFTSNIQEFTSVGLNEFGFNQDLKGILMEDTTYYATVKAINSAGLSSVNTSSGITVSFRRPNVSNTKSEIIGSVPVNDKGDDIGTVASHKQSELEFSWDTPSDTNADIIYCGVGTGQENDDIFPELPCAQNSSGRVKISDTGVSIDDESHTNLSDIKPQRRRRSIDNQIFLEPGRMVYLNVKVCSKTHLCDKIPINNVIIMKPQDRSMTPNATGHLQGRFTMNEPGSLRFIDITSQQKQESSVNLVVGTLSAADFKANYKSEASRNFKPYIVDPISTLNRTSRKLHQRVTTMLEGGFHFTVLPDHSIIGPLIIKIGFPDGVFAKDSNTGIPTLLMWCTNENIWVDIGGSCSNDFVSHVDWNKRILTTAVCNVVNYCQQNGQRESRFKRQTGSGNGATGSGALAIGGTSSTFINSPPIITSVTIYTLSEDHGTLNSFINAQDPESDKFTFVINTTYPYTGLFTLQPSGEFTYKPCTDCFGIDTVHFIVKEDRTDGNRALETYGTLTFNITEVNDNPVLLLVVQGNAKTGNTFLVVDQYDPSNKGYTGLDIILISYDLDLNSIKLTVEGQKHGNALLHSQVEPFNVSYPDCSKPWDGNRQLMWENAVSGIQQKVPFTLPVPCNIENDVKNKTVFWLATAVTYTPNQQFFGEDMIKVVARDATSSVSEVLNVKIYVLAYPCLNNGNCSGPTWDNNCTDLSRAYGFENYTCLCQQGYTGQFCEVDINECLSQPCANNYTCVDLVNEYQCKCEQGWPCNVPTDGTDSFEDGGMETWLIIVIAAAAFLVLLFFVACIVCVIRCSTTDDGSDTQSLYRNKRIRRGFEERSEESIPMKLVGIHALKSKPYRHAYANPAYNHDIHTHQRHPKGHRSQPHYRNRFSDRSISESSYVRQSDPVKRWFPSHFIDEGSLYSSGYRHDRNENRPDSEDMFHQRDARIRRLIPHKIKRLRLNRSRNSEYYYSDA